jgi:phage host-nuclease inhibitor protein Gam
MMSDAELTAAEAELTDMHREIERLQRKATDLTARILAEYRARHLPATVHQFRPPKGMPPDDADE